MDECKPAVKEIKPGWKLPEPPEPGYVAVVSNAGYGWYWGWECEETGQFIFPDMDKFSWPFVDSHACAVDWERLGVRVD